MREIGGFEFPWEQLQPQVSVPFPSLCKWGGLLQEGHPVLKHCQASHPDYSTVVTS